jgi:DNA-binding NtrC family response regulator
MGDHILVVDDEAPARNALRSFLEALGHEVETAESVEEALSKVEKNPPWAIFTDLVMPGLDGLEFIRRLHKSDDIPVVVFSAQGTEEQALEAMKLGAQDYLEKPVEPAKLKILLTRLGRTRDLEAEKRRLEVEKRLLKAELRERGAFERLRGESEKMLVVFRQIEQVAPSTLSVLIVGESGTGKELVARTLHELSGRCKFEFVELNCAAIPATLLESEIFGHERGSFTGAFQRKIGCFEMANHGTLFLDEIAEMEENLQAKLLRVLQEQRFRRVGGRDMIEADVRVIAATNKDPMKAIADRKLREDLYYRLNAFTIALPALREHPEDIRSLSRHFAEQYATRTGGTVPAIHQSTMEALLAHPWPGNVRELKNAIERATLLSGGGTILPQHLPPEVLTSRAASEAHPSPVPPGEPDAGTLSLRIGTTMDDAEREMIRSTLAHTGGNKTQAARILRISLKTMHNKVKKYQL